MMATMENSVKSTRKRRKKRKIKAKNQSGLSVVSLRISSQEKERIDEIMRIGNIKRYSDVLRMAIKMVQVSENDEIGFSETFH